mgnify:CR=1 FL=1
MTKNVRVSETNAYTRFDLIDWPAAKISAVTDQYQPLWDSGRD